MEGESTNFLSDENMKKMLSQIEDEEAEIDSKLVDLMSQKSNIELEVQGISDAIPNLHLVKGEAKQLEEMIYFTSKLADKVSSKVRQLDLARSRVSDCQKRVHDLLDLQLCSNGVDVCLQNEDYEKAAGHIHRFLSMDQSLLEQTADDMAQDCTTVTNSFKLLQQAASNLRNIISKKFQQAVKEEDLASVERYFKIFPLIGMHQDGLEQYSQFISSKLSSSFKNNISTIQSNEQRATVIFADLLTFLFETIAREIETQQSLIDSYYGENKILTLMKIIHARCDELSQSILNDFTRSRQIEIKISSINEHSKIKSTSNIERIDSKQLDCLLNEMTIMHSRYMLYVRFMKRRTAESSELDAFIGKSEICRRMQEVLGNYLFLERYYLEESIKKAIQMDAVEETSLQSSMVDDVFFIIRKCIRRACSSGSMDGICTVINNGSSMLEDQFCNALHQYLRQGYPSGYLDLTQAYNVVIQGGRNDSELARIQFLTFLNNAEVAIEYITTLVQSLNDEIPCVNDRDKEKLNNCLSGLSGVTSSLNTVKEYGIQQLRSAAIKPRIAPWIDVYTTLNHNLSEDEFVAYEANEPFIGSLVTHLDTLLSEFKPRLTTNNYDALISILALEVTSHLERVIMKCEFNRLGGMALEKEVRSLVSYLSGATSWTIRDRLARLMQISTVLNLDKVSEISDYTTGPTWRLSTNDVQQFMSLRIDLNKDEIKRL